MTFHLLHASSAGQIDTARPIIKADERQTLDNAMALMASISRQAEAQAEKQAQAIDDARREGFREGFEGARSAMTTALAELTAQIDAEQQRRSDDVASAAYAAVQAILGNLPADVVTPALARQAAAHLTSGGDTVVAVAPSMVEPTRAALAEQPHVSVTEDEALGPLDCVIRSGKGYVLASMETQLAALAERWGLADVIVPERHG